MPRAFNLGRYAALRTAGQRLSRKAALNPRIAYRGMRTCR
ncbi:hypothetical protein HMPREF9413_3874 [Paenibacillus sp. HGF7]|nr:hypothetical protein HMPREF9413_3874 [Paenibacillus sp. HGF7]